MKDNSPQPSLDKSAINQEEYNSHTLRALFETEKDESKINDDEEDKEEEPEYIQWLKIGKNNYFPEGKIKPVKVLKPGVYDIAYSKQRATYYAIHKKLALDELFLLPDPIQDKIIKDIQTFWTRKKEFKKYGYAYKRGILLWGEPGSGKTSIMNLLSKELMEKYKGIVFYLSVPDDLDPFIGFMTTYFRQIQPDTNVICVIEDIEAFCENHHTEGQILNLLDGLNNMENIVFLASTNYPEKLKARILNRPSRFDRRYELKSPNALVRKTYFEHKLKPEDLEKIDLNYWVKATDKLTVSHLGEIVKSVCVLGNSFDETIKELKSMAKKISSFDYNKSDEEEGIGFKTNSYPPLKIKKESIIEDDSCCEGPDPSLPKKRY